MISFLKMVVDITLKDDVCEEAKRVMKNYKDMLDIDFRKFLRLGLYNQNNYAMVGIDKVVVITFNKASFYGYSESWAYKPTCPYCHKVMSFMEQNNIELLCMISDDVPVSASLRLAASVRFHVHGNGSPAITLPFRGLPCFWFKRWFRWRLCSSCLHYRRRLLLLGHCRETLSSRRVSRHMH